MRQYLGLDVAPLRIGWAVVSENAGVIKPIAHGTHLFDKKEWIVPSMRAEAMEDLHDAHKIEPAGIGMEAVYVGINKLGSIRAAMALGQIESICDYEWPDAEQKVLTATQWRKVCGIPQGGKPPVLAWAEAYTGETIDSQDDADALAIAYATAMWFTTEHE